MLKSIYNILDDKWILESNISITKNIQLCDIKTKTSG